MSPVKLAALPLSASTNNVVKTPRPFCSVAYWSLVEAVKNDKTGAFTQGATAKPEDVGYYFDNDGVIFFVNEGVVAPASSGLVTVERLN